MVANIAYYKNVFFVIAGTNTRKNLNYQSIPEVIGDIVLVISLTIVLIEDQT